MPSHKSPVPQNPYVLPAPTFSGAVSTYELWVDELARSSPTDKHLTPQYRFTMSTPAHTEVNVSLLHLYTLRIHNPPRKRTISRKAPAVKGENMPFYMCHVENVQMLKCYIKKKKKLFRSESSSSFRAALIGLLFSSLSLVILCTVHHYFPIFFPLTPPGIVKMQQRVPSGPLV